MKRVTYRTPFGTERVLATNPNGEGLFERGVREGAYRQTHHNATRFPVRSPKAFILSLRKRGILRLEDEVLSMAGWE